MGLVRAGASVASALASPGLAACIRWLVAVRRLGGGRCEMRCAAATEGARFPIAGRVALRVPAAFRTCVSNFVSSEPAVSAARSYGARLRPTLPQDCRELGGGAPFCQ